jgi:hypothetical protein
VCNRYLIVVPRPLPEKPFLVRRTYLIIVPRPVPRPLPAATRRCRNRRRTLGRLTEEKSKYYQDHLHRGKVTHEL